MSLAREVNEAHREPKSRAVCLLVEESHVQDCQVKGNEIKAPDLFISHAAHYFVKRGFINVDITGFKMRSSAHDQQIFLSRSPHKFINLGRGGNTDISLLSWRFPLISFMDTVDIFHCRLLPTAMYQFSVLTT